MAKIDEIMTFTEAAEKYNLAGGATLRQFLFSRKFLPGEVRQSGNVWLITVEAMDRLFSHRKHDLE
jgi:hypothetical protein